MPKQQPTAVVIAPYLGVHKEVTQEIMTGRTSSASDKLQVKPLIKSLNMLGYKTNAISLNKNFKISDLQELNHPEICFVSKLRSHPTEDDHMYAMFHQSCILHLKRKGTKIAVLYSDNLARKDTPDGELYKNILFLSDAVISPSSILISHAKKWARPQTLTAVVKDPCLVPQKPYKHLSANDICQVLWFGNNSNIQYLRTTLSQLVLNSPRERRYQFTFLATTEGLKEISTILSEINTLSNWKFRLVQWKYNNQPQQLTEELSAAHITFIPSDPSDPNKSGVSHNRLTDSIQSGCIAVASPMNSYLELAKVSLLGINLSQLFNKAVFEYNRLAQKYTSLRQAYLSPFQTQENYDAWKNIICTIRNMNEF